MPVLELRAPFRRHARADKRLQTFRAEIEQLLPVVLLLILRQPVLRLRDLEFPVSLHCDQAHTQIRPAYSFIRR